MPNDESKPSYSGSFVLGSAGGDLLTISADGTVKAPTLEAASEAGRVFVESVRHHIGQLRGQRY